MATGWASTGVEGTVFIPPLYPIQLQTGDPQQQKAAIRSVTSLHKWGVFVFDLNPLEHGYTKEFARRLIRKGYLDEEEYIVRLVGKVITVSVETVRLVNELALAVTQDDWMP